MRKIDVDIARRVTLCVSFNEMSSIKIYHLYKVSANKTAHLCDVTDQITQLKSDVKCLMITKSDYKNAITAKSYNNIVINLIYNDDVIINLRHKK